MTDRRPWYRFSNRYRFIVVLAPILALRLGVGMALPAHAATFNVDRVDDDATATTCDDASPNDCSLRGAILAANARPMSEASTVNVPAGTYVLSVLSSCTFRRHDNPSSFTDSQVPLCVTRNVTVQGAGAGTTVIDGNRAHRVLTVSADATVELRGVTITHGLGDRSLGLNPNGGGIENDGTLTLSDSAVSESSPDPTAGGAGGGGIYNVGVLTLLRSTVSDNFAPANQLGGGILNDQQAILTVSDSTISNNTIGFHGGGICNLEGVVTVTGSTLSGNTANSLGGGIANFGGNFIGTLTALNATISGNTSSAGGGIYNHAFTDAHLNNVTVTSNTAHGSGGGIMNNSGGLLTLHNTVIAGNGAPALPPTNDCSAVTPLVSQGYNLIQTTGGCAIGGDLTGNIIGQDPRLAILLNNGGFSKTHALRDTSPAIDAGNPAAPGSGGFACAASDQRGILRPLGTTCDIGAFERTTAFSVAKVLPNTGGNTGSVSVFVGGNGFVDGAMVKLTRAGEADIAGNPAQVDVGGSSIAARFDLAGKSIGPWDVVVTNPDGASQTLTGGLAIEPGRAQLWVDVIGLVLRSRPSPFTIVYGNRGNVDALAVPLSISTSSSYGLSASFGIAPPPPQADQVNVNWSQVPILVDGDATSTNVPLLLPVIPAGFTGSFRIALRVPPEATASSLFVGINSPYFTPTLDPQIVSTFVQTAQTYAQEGVNMTIPPVLIPDLEQYVTNQLQLIVNNGRNAFVANLGASPQVYSLSQLQIDAALFGARLALATGQVSVRPQETPNWPATGYQVFVSLLSQLEAEEAQAVNCPIVVCDPKTGQSPEGAVTAGCETSCDRPNDLYMPPPIPAPPGCDPVKVNELLKSLSGTASLVTSPPDCRLTSAHCDALPNYKLIRFPDGSSACIEQECGKKYTTASGKTVTDDCKRLPVDPKTSRDPNDKAGPLGTTAAQFLVGQTPLSYAIHFENLETATAAAQEVVITDQLDALKVDLESFRLGPISFGQNTLVPAAGAQQYTGGVDLRPGQNLIVTIRAGLDASTGLVAWRFTSIDPDTGQFTEDPDAGFLPPNINPPAGEGSVAFTVNANAGLMTGTEIRNQARIVFDDNDPIDTPEWSNAIDDTDPVSAVESLAPTQPSSDFTVQWAGSDVGSGIADYTIFVSENGGPFTEFVSATPDTSAVFSGTAGRTYRFYSVARDLVGHEEAPPAAPDVVTQIVVDLCPVDPSKTAPGACGCGVPDTDSDLNGVPDCQDETPTPTEPLTPTLTVTATPSGPPTQTGTDSPAPTNTPMATSTETPTHTRTGPFTLTATATPTNTRTPSETGTFAPTSTQTATLPPTSTPTRTITPTATPSSTAVVPATIPSTGTVTPTDTPVAPTSTTTATQGRTATRTATPAPPPRPCPGDTDGNGHVDSNDVVLVARALFSTAGRPRWNPAADLNHNGSVDLIDLLIVLQSLADLECRLYL
jgi:hypothetical protein